MPVHGCDFGAWGWSRESGTEEGGSKMMMNGTAEPFVFDELKFRWHEIVALATPSVCPPGMVS